MDAAPTAAQPGASRWQHRAPPRPGPGTLPAWFRVRDRVGVRCRGSNCTVPRGWGNVSSERHGESDLLLLTIFAVAESQPFKCGLVGNSVITGDASFSD